MGVIDQLRFGGSIAKVAATVSVERLRPPGPVHTADEVPARVGQLTTDWLTGALCGAAPGAAVTGFTLGSGSDGTASRRALTVSYNDAGRSAGLPTAIYTKSTPALVNRVLIGITGAAAAEALFYGHIRQGLPVGAPTGYYGAFDHRTCRSMILMEDIAETRRATFGDALTHVDRTEAESMVCEMAAYHGALWEDPRLDHQWTSLLDSAAWQQVFNSNTQMDAGGVFAFRLARDEIPAELHRHKAEVRPAFSRALKINAAGPRTLIHQDVHPGNWFRTPAGALHLYDWQSIAKGHWALDVAYALSAGLDVEDRRAWERELLALYIDELGAAGGKPPTFDEAWQAYRQQMLHGLIFWTYTLLVGQLRWVQPEPVVRALIRRTAQAAADLQTLESLR